MKSGTRVTVFSVPKMDCPSEERLVRMALEKSALISNIAFDLTARTVTVTHLDSVPNLLELLEPLRYAAREIETREAETNELSSDQFMSATDQAESKALYWLLGIN